MPNNKKKTVDSVKGAERAHPYSRKAAQLKRAVLREDKVARKRIERDSAKRLVVERMLWFKFAVPEDASCLTETDAHATIDMYIRRNDDEINRLRSQLRPGRPRPPKLELLESLAEKDAKEYAAGVLEVPVLTDAKNILVLRKYEGDHNSIADIKIVRMRDPKSAKESTKQESKETNKSNSTEMEI